GAMRGEALALHALTRFQGGVDVLDHRVDGGDAPCRISPAPAIRPKAGAGLAFRLFPQILYRSVDHRDTGAFGDGMPGAENPRRPGVVAFEYGRRSQRDQRLY